MTIRKQLKKLLLRNIFYETFFLDTNIIIDFLANREPFSHYAANLFELAHKKKITIYISAVSYNTIYYILQQSTSNANAIKLLASIEELSEIIEVTKEVIKNSLRSEFKDFEDAIQYYTALSNKKIEVIVTRNGKDFKKVRFLFYLLKKQSCCCSFLPSSYKTYIFP